MTKANFKKILDSPGYWCYNTVRKNKEKEILKMKYAVTGFKFYKEFATEAEARACFEAVKAGFTYCELKRIENRGYYYAESIEIFCK